ncbi:MAG: 3-hydroxyacyl-CoA dehydrogenase NAD-binding domain-containing protein [Bacteroidales bacterium]|nr:3-hydroxyacyl-CoA dehydrogenase NAD-binding domain-containing protein [Bacteroidales bacterium]MCF6341830.1 3-hydroxyacyl-CoA dehydrogenase NAD-binding domain-containing protein [Bacteroidales bacterium]
MIRRIKKVAVLGSGVMGSGIACHFANIGTEVLLIDIVPRELNDKEKAAGLTLESKAVRNRIVNDSLKAALKSKPSPIYKQSFAKRITTGNFDDDLQNIKDCDWVIEVVIERLDIKKSVFEKVEKFRKAGSLITTNTSGISVEAMIEGRSEDFQKHFCGTHFFNPPRYLQLFEIIPTTKTDPEVLGFLTDYASRYLGKTPVLAKDTPAFIANRIGTFSIMELFNNVHNLDLTIPEIDKLTGPVIGRAKSATFRTADIVGLDTLVHVANNIKETTDDEANDLFAIPDYLQKMLDNKWLGSKTKQGFFKKVVEDGKKKFLSLDFKTMEYVEAPRPKFGVFEKTKGIDDLRERMPVLFADKGKVGDFYRSTFYALFQFVSNRIPEITSDIYKVDDALNAGFGWKLGPFQTWDAVGVEATVKAMEEAGKKPAQWVYDMLEAGITSFYKVEHGFKNYYDIASKSYKVIPGQEDRLSLEVLRESNVLWENTDITIFDLGDGVINVEFHTKMNTIGAGVLEGLNKAIDMAEADYKAVVVSNEGEHFSAGANVGMIYMLAIEQEWEELDMAVQWFQKTMMRMRYSSIPVIAAPHGMALGGGCELCLHSDKVIAHAETYMGLVEFGVGLIPGGGGTKEFAVRLSDELKEGDIRTNAFLNRYLSIGQAKVSMSAYEAFDLGYLRTGIDEVIVSRAHHLAYAKKAALNMVEKGYTQPAPRNDIKVLGKEALGAVYVGADGFTVGNYMSEHDKLIAEKLGVVLAGGEISQALTEVSEQYLLDLERKTFMELCTQRKTLERIQSIITKGKILRN